MGGCPTKLLVDTGAACSTLRATEFPHVQPSLEIVNAIGVTNVTVPHPVSEPTNVTLGPISTEHAFLLSPCSPINLLGQDLLCKLGCIIYCQPDGFYLDVPPSVEHPVTACLSLFPKEVSLHPLHSLSDSSLTALQTELLSKVPEALWSTHADDIGCIRSTDPA